MSSPDALEAEVEAEAERLRTTPLEELRREVWAALPRDAELAVAAMRRLTPARRGQLLEVFKDLGSDGWLIQRALVREGLAPRPADEAYILGLFQRHYDSVHELLRRDPGLLDWEVWRIFEVEGGGDRSPAAFDKYLGEDDGWHAALVRVAARGALERGRLLDASLDALARDFAQFRAGWYSRFHIALAPTTAERAARAERYLGLVASRIPPTVSFALAMLDPLLAAGALDAGRLVAALEPALLASAKGTVRAALDLLARAAAAAPELALAVARSAALALAHAAPEVQKAALAVIERYAEPADAALRSALAARAEHVAPSLRTRLARYLGEAVAVPAEVAAEPLGAIAVEARGPVPVAAIDDLATLVDRWLALLEDDSLTLDVERVLDGASRLAAIDASERAARMAPVVARAKKLLKRPWPGTIAGDLARLALAWSGVAYEEPEARDDVGRVFGARVERIAERLAAGRAAALLSAPTHEAGFVDPSALVARVARVGVDAFDGDDVVDPVLALLRLAPWGREAALQAAARLKSELGLALRHALGGKVAVGPTAALWIAAARARHPDGDDAAVAARHPGLGPDAAEVARQTWTSRPYATTWDELAIAVAPAVPRKMPLAHVAVGLHGEGRRDGRRAGSELGLVRWALTLRPGGSESLFAEGATALFSDLYTSEPEKYLHAFLEPLAEAWTALGPMAVLCLTVGLASKAPDERLRAVDALARAVDDGRLDAAAVGATLARLLLTQRAVAGRWAKSLGEVARLSPRHARAVVEVVTAALRGEVERAPKDIGAVLELLHELLVELDLGLTDPDARAWLDALAAARGGKGRALARSVLARG